MRSRIARWIPLVVLLMLTGCRTREASVTAIDPSPSTESLRATDGADSADARASVVEVRGCVTVDGTPAPAARVEAYTAGEGRWSVPLAEDGCFRVERAVGRLNGLQATAPERGRVVAYVLPIAGALDVELAIPGAERIEAATLRSDDLASRLAAVAGWYMLTLRGHPTAEHLQAVARRHDAEADPEVRAAYGLVYVALARSPGAQAPAIEPRRIAAAIAALSPTHVAWSVEMEAIILASRAGDVSQAYVDRVFAEHPDLLVLGAAALSLVSAASQAGDHEGVRAMLTRLRQRGADSPLGKIALEFDPDDRLAEGRPLPPFRLHALGGGPEIDSEALRGKVLVLHVWATWCHPCVEKVPALAALHARYAGEGLEVVSLAIDEDPAVVTAFRRDRQAMPWTHAWEAPKIAEELRARYQVAGSTKAIVVGRDGVVIAEHLTPGEPEFEARIIEALARR